LSLKISFLRHGETSYSKIGTYCGEVDAELTAEGAQMAKASADAYRSVAWTAVYVSPMKRTIATAQPLCDALGLEMQLRPELEEIDYGKWEDQTVDYVKQHYWDDYIHWLAEPAWKRCRRLPVRQQGPGSARRSDPRPFLGPTRRRGRSHEHALHGRANRGPCARLGSGPNVPGRRVQSSQAERHLRRLGKVSSLEGTPNG
jgi:Histidine phosphatase superfamily (branch 1)